MIKLLQGDCLEVMPTLDRRSIDMVLVDLPYEQTNREWDINIDLKQMWQQLDCCCKRSCVYVFFCTTRFGVDIINSRKSWFRYDLVWEKSNYTGHLSSAHLPLRGHEMMYVFGDMTNDDLDITCNLGLREYAKQCKEFINTPLRQIEMAMGNMGISHFYGHTATQFGLPTPNNYAALIKLYGLDQMSGFRPHESLQHEWSINENNKTYNPQRTAIGEAPISVLKVMRDRDIGHHPTQKPVPLLSWLISSYTNAGDTVLDFTMGSGSTGVACKRLKRSFIGIEKEKTYFDVAIERIKNADRQGMLF